MKTQANDEGDDYDRKRAEDRQGKRNLFDILRDHRIPLNSTEEKEFGKKKDASVRQTW